MALPTLAADAALRSIQRGTSALDVRAEREWTKGAFPGSRNVPILNDEHRHLVGTCYKESGQDAAIALGHTLVDPIRDALVEQWAKSGAAFLFCWRGGLRSKLAQQWLTDAGHPLPRVEGGYRALRQTALAAIESPPPLLLIAGLTGSGKTELFHDHPDFLDLEKAADHKGSAFGRRLDGGQNTQQNFEHMIGTMFFQRSRRVLVEDESRMIGHIHIPPTLYETMRQAPTVFVESTVEERAHRIVRDYIVHPLQSDTPPAALESFLLDGVRQIASRLGPELAQKARNAISDAFAHGPADAERHHWWVAALLEHYYDKAYTHAKKRKNRPVLFSGSGPACREWIDEHADQFVAA